MCLLTYVPPKVQPDADSLLNGTLTNSDGHGWAMIADGELIIGKSLNGIDAVNEFVEMRRHFPDGPAMFHSRYGTGGTVDLGNCHPFYIGADKRTVIAHNGILFSPARHEQRSDTRIMAETIIPNQYPKLWTRRHMKKLVTRLGTHNRVVILTANPRYTRSAYILGEKTGVWDQGVWYSNYGYCAPLYLSRAQSAIAKWDETWLSRKEGYYFSSKTPSEPTWSDDLDPNPCLICGGRYTVDRYSMFCDSCDHCQECMCHQDLCQCYTPTSPYAAEKRSASS